MCGGWASVSVCVDVSEIGVCERASDEMRLCVCARCGVSVSECVGVSEVCEVCMSECE